MAKTAKRSNTGKDGKKFDNQKFPKKVEKYYEKYNKNIPLVNKKTLVGSMGSCFAINIANFLKENGYNYITMEDKMTNSGLIPADWGAVYNVPCVRQIFQYSFEDFNPIVRGWPMKENKNGLIDPFRRDITYHNSKKEQNFQNHIKNSKKVLGKTEVFIITLGLVEIGRDKRDHSTFWKIVPKHLYDPEIHEFHIMTVDEVLGELYRTKELIDKYNPKCKLIVTVSPVPLFATFRQDTDPVSANMNSKSTLRTAVDMFVRNTENVYYFPAYEAVFHRYKKPFEPDGRHVKPEAVNSVMKLFERMFVER